MSDHRGEPRRPEPTGTCWCGCGDATGEGAFFVPGHDGRAFSKLVRRYGGLAGVIEALGGVEAMGEEASP